MKILAFDIARNTGIAVGSTDGEPVAWSVNLGKSHEARFSKALQLTASLIIKHQPDLIAIEDVVGRAKTPHVNVGIVACVRGVACNRGIPVLMCPVQTVRKHFVGRAYTAKDFPGLTANKAREAIKAQVMGRCALLGWSVPDDDAADAAAIWDYAMATRSRSYQAAPVGGMFA
jgi:Holliday junction resolvasome RuvABC endonuclease subunit